MGCNKKQDSATQLDLCSRILKFIKKDYFCMSCFPGQPSANKFDEI